MGYVSDDFNEGLKTLQAWGQDINIVFGTYLEDGQDEDPGNLPPLLQPLVVDEVIKLAGMIHATFLGVQAICSMPQYKLHSLMTAVNELETLAYLLVGLGGELQEGFKKDTP